MQFIPGSVTALDAGSRTVRLADGRELGGDRLVYALGAVADICDVPGVAEHAHTLDTPADARSVAARPAAPDTARVVVAGAGLTGVESAAEFAERHPGVPVVLLSREEPAVMLGPRARDHVHRVMDSLGLVVRAGAEVVKVLPGGVELAGGEHVPADAVLWTAGVRGSALAVAAGLRVDHRGRIVTDAALRSVSHPHLYAVGDAAAIRQTYAVIDGTCQSGIPSGAHAAVSIVRELRGREPKPFRFGYIHRHVSLGRRDAVVQFTHADGTPARGVLTGRPAVIYKDRIIRSVAPVWRLVRWVPAALVWPHGGRATQAGRA